MTEQAQLIVPWVTLWDSEVVDRLSVNIGLTPAGIFFYDEHPMDRLDGVLWVREKVGIGNGKPVWAEVHGRRQRQAMLRPRCQVCGKRLPPVDTPWLLPRAQWESGLPLITPPTCAECWPIAEARCPHLRTADPVRLHATARPWGVMGDCYHPAKKRPRAWAKFGSSLMPWMMAKQLAVDLVDRKENVLTCTK